LFICFNIFHKVYIKITFSFFNHINKKKLIIMHNVWIVTTDLTEDQNKDLIKNLSEDDQNMMSELDLKISVDLIDEENHITSVMVCNKIDIEKIKDFLTRNNVKWGVEDGTNLFENIEGLTEEIIVEKMCGYVDSER